MFRVNVDRFYDTNPQGRRRRHERAERRAPLHARLVDRRRPTTPSVVSPNLLNEARFAYLNGDPVTLLGGADALDHLHARRLGAVHDRPVARVRLSSAARSQFSDTLSWSRGKHDVRLGGSVARHTSGGTGSEPGTAVLGTFTFLNTTTAPFDQLTLADVQNYTQPINFGITSYKLTQWLIAGFVQDSIRVSNDLTLDLGLRYDRQTLTDANEELRAARRLRLASGRRLAHSSIRGGYGMYYTQIQSNLIAGYLVERPRRPHDLHRDAGQTRLPDLPDRAVPAAVVRSARRCRPSQLPARDITIQAGQRGVLPKRSSRSTA